MEIILHEIPRMSIEEFADKHGLVMEVFERKQIHSLINLPKYYAHFKSTEIKDGSFLSGAYGNGDSPQEAIADYSQQLSGKKLVFDAYNEKKRRVIDAPILV